MWGGREWGISSSLVVRYVGWWVGRQTGTKAGRWDCMYVRGNSVCLQAKRGAVENFRNVHYDGHRG